MKEEYILYNKPIVEVLPPIIKDIPLYEDVTPKMFGQEKLNKRRRWQKK